MCESCRYSKRTIPIFLILLDMVSLAVELKKANFRYWGPMVDSFLHKRLKERGIDGAQKEKEWRRPELA